MATAPAPLGNKAYHVAHVPEAAKLIADLVGPIEGRPAKRGGADYVVADGFVVIFRVRRPRYFEHHRQSVTIRWVAKDKESEADAILGGFGDYFLYAYGADDYEEPGISHWVLCALAPFRSECARLAEFGRLPGEEGPWRDPNSRYRIIGLAEIPNWVLRSNGVPVPTDPLF